MGHIAPKCPELAPPLPAATTVSSLPPAAGALPDAVAGPTPPLFGAVAGAAQQTPDTVAAPVSPSTPVSSSAPSPPGPDFSPDSLHDRIDEAVIADGSDVKVEPGSPTASAGGNDADNNIFDDTDEDGDVVCPKRSRLCLLRSTEIGNNGNVGNNGRYSTFGDPSAANVDTLRDRFQVLAPGVYVVSAGKDDLGHCLVEISHGPAKRIIALDGYNDEKEPPIAVITHSFQKWIKNVKWVCRVERQPGFHGNRKSKTERRRKKRLQQQLQQLWGCTLGIDADFQAPFIPAWSTFALISSSFFQTRLLYQLSVPDLRRVPLVDSSSPIHSTRNWVCCFRLDVLRSCSSSYRWTSRRFAKRQIRTPISNRDETSGNNVQFRHVFNEKSSDAISCIRLRGRDEMATFRQSVNNNSDGIDFTLRLRQVGYNSMEKIDLQRLSGIIQLFEYAG
ncbi:unnamed protein product [Phytophthora fragariaefolia]|uniref:Unnamed protein product n=1 Tax=Phytophthora fragariaefolia TaxID=1490495 RepID=A0A9W7CWP0_9STRA|nr:unnamed protein product [Phytophthora fragariaefolia]